MKQGRSKILRAYIPLYGIKHLRIGSKPGQHQLLGSISAVLLLLPSPLFYRCLGLSRDRRARERQVIHHAPQVFITNLVFPGNTLHVIVTLKFLRKFQQFFCNGSVKFCFVLRVRQIILPFHDLDLEQKIIHGLSKPLFNSLLSLSLDKFIGVLIRSQIHHSGLDARLPENRNSPECRLLPGLIAVIGQKHFLCVTAHETGMPACKGSSQRSHRIGETRLVHGDHIHIPLTDDQIVFSRSSGNIKPVQVAALIKDLRLRRIQVLGLRIAHNTASEADHPVIHIHNGKHDTVPELVVHSISLISGEKTGFF